VGGPDDKTRSRTSQARLRAAIRVVGVTTWRARDRGRHPHGSRHERAFPPVRRHHDSQSDPAVKTLL